MDKSFADARYFHDISKEKPSFESSEVCDWCSEHVAISTCGRCGSRRYCGRACQAQDWRDGGHRLSCKARAASDLPCRVYLVLESLGEGGVRAFFDLSAAKAHATATFGDIRRPMTSEEFASGPFQAPQGSFIGDDGVLRGPDGRTLIVSHPDYKPPTAASKEFYIAGTASSLIYVAKKVGRCTVGISNLYESSRDGFSGAAAEVAAGNASAAATAVAGNNKCTWFCSEVAIMATS
jgi:hypothetical protein